MGEILDRASAVLRRAEALLERAGLGDKYGALPANLSGGEKQRVAIARALAGEPEIILADEPTAALDSHSGRVVIELLSHLAHERGRAVVIVTHDSRTRAFADRIVHIEDGKIQEAPAGTPAGGVWANDGPMAYSFQRR